LVLCKQRNLPQVCVNLWNFFGKPKIRLDLTRVFPGRSVDKAVDNVDNSNYVNSYNNLQFKLCKLYDTAVFSMQRKIRRFTAADSAINKRKGKMKMKK